MGLIPWEIEDKWFVYFAEPVLSFHRNWTDTPVYVRASATPGAWPLPSSIGRS